MLAWPARCCAAIRLAHGYTKTVYTSSNFVYHTVFHSPWSRTRPARPRRHGLTQCKPFDAFARV